MRVWFSRNGLQEINTKGMRSPIETPPSLWRNRKLGPELSPSSWMNTSTCLLLNSCVCIHTPPLSTPPSTPPSSSPPPPPAAPPPAPSPPPPPPPLCLACRYLIPTEETDNTIGISWMKSPGVKRSTKGWCCFSNYHGDK